MLVLLADPPGPRTGPVSEHEPGMCVSDLRARIGRAHALVSHHVQVLLGITGRVRAADQQDPAGKNARSVRLELQADCFAGIWKHATSGRTRCVRHLRLMNAPLA